MLSFSKCANWSIPWWLLILPWEFVVVYCQGTVLTVLQLQMSLLSRWVQITVLSRQEEGQTSKNTVGSNLWWQWKHQWFCWLEKCHHEPVSRAGIALLVASNVSKVVLLKGKWGECTSSLQLSALDSKAQHEGISGFPGTPTAVTLCSCYPERHQRMLQTKLIPGISSLC